MDQKLHSSLKLLIGNKSFESEHEAKQYVRHLLAKYPIDSKVTDNQDIEFLRSLVQRHPDFGVKWKGTIEHFFVVRNRRQKATELKLNFNNQEGIQIPWVVCI